MPTAATAITLHPIDRQNWRAALALGVRPEQQRFVAGYQPIAAIVLAKAYVRPGGLVWAPYLLYAAQEPVGLVALTYAPDSTDNYWINHFFIDQHYQERGYGQQALAALLAFISSQHPHCTRLRLTVHPENVAAQRLYRSVGFAPTDALQDDEPVYQLALAKGRT